MAQSSGSRTTPASSGSSPCRHRARHDRPPACDTRRAPRSARRGTPWHRSRRSARRRQASSSADTAEHILKVGAGETARLGVVAAAVVAVDQHPATGQFMARAMGKRKPIASGPAPSAPPCAPPVPGQGSPAVQPPAQFADRWGLQVLISDGSGLFSGGRHLTALLMRQSINSSPSSAATDSARDAKPKACRVSYSRMPA
jgi:hypothetical protein